MQRPRAGLVPIVLAALAAGCAVRAGVPATASPAAVPAWTSTAPGLTATARGDLSAWWIHLGDATLTSLIEQAVAESPTVELARARLRQVRAQQAQANADLWPTISGSGSASGRRSGTRVFSPDGSQTVANNVFTGSYGASLDASWEPDVFGTTRQGIEAARVDTAAAVADLQSTRVSLAAEVALSYAELRALQERLAIAGRNEASQAETLELSGFRVQAGLVSSVDVEQARSNLEQTRAQLPTLQASIRHATFRLATLTGAGAGFLTPMLEQSAPLPPVPDEIAVGIPAETLRQRPDVRAAELRVVAETARLVQAGLRRYPRFSLSGTVGLEVLTGAMTGGTNTVASVAAGLAQTLFDGGRIRQQIAIQNAVQEQAVANYESTVLTALEDVERALVSLDASRRRLASLQAATSAAESAASLARSQYSAGLADFQTVLNTERSVLTLQDGIAQTSGDRLSALVQLYKALGGGWSPDAPITSSSDGPSS